MVNMGRLKLNYRTKLVTMLVLPTVVSLIFYLALARYFGQFLFLYLPFNLMLAWIPLLFSGTLIWYLKTHSWSSWPAIVLTLLWLLFLPNSFYLMTDLIHLDAVYPSDVDLVAAMMVLFTFSGMLVGFYSMILLQRQLLRRLSAAATFGWLALVLAACSFAIYIGRDLRLNSWDVLVHPSGLLFDLSDKLIHPGQYAAIVGQTASYFVVLMTIFIVIWPLGRKSDRI